MSLSYSEFLQRCKVPDRLKENAIVFDQFPEHALCHERIVISQIVTSFTLLLEILILGINHAVTDTSGKIFWSSIMGDLQWK